MSDHRLNRSGRRPWLPYLALGGASVALLVEVVKLAALGVPWPIVVGFALIIPALFVVYFFRRRLMAIFIRRANIPTQSQRLAIGPYGLTMATKTTASLTAWEGIDRIVVTDYAFFYFNEVAAHVLPRRA